ncbi:hypothetical protein SLA2020_396450 [Shorea laevis]
MDSRCRGFPVGEVVMWRVLIRLLGPDPSALAPTMHLGSGRWSRHGYMVSSQKSRKGSPNKEILRRVLTPPNRQMSLRWWNFRPTPSRLYV